MIWKWIFILGGASVLFFAITAAERARLRKLLDRPCAGIHWHRRFPTVKHDDIHEFLALFTEAFAFDSVHRSKFSPEDQPMALYEARYIPHLTMDDHFEFESLDEVLDSRYGIDLSSVWHKDITLGELFALTQLTSTPRATKLS
ncbi:hypothetical protein Pan258_29400 [Symmachiella dynata]|uniref:hypothetical protein n=1 Tax=Symmachiella dynata TaxID=2527995 RepID=UPI0011889757|nr:hypothetical protein [Symmachiella dynata]QDT48893.1 hypothetical protein Pan258_29400 [Symmachiella dynata]